MALLGLPAFELPGKSRMARAFALYVEMNVPFVDAFHVALMEQLRLTEIVSFDRDYDRVPGMRRVEP